MLLPPLKPGSRFQTLIENSLTLFAHGWPKGEAMAIALTVAGYRPPPAPTSPTHPSTAIH